MPADPEPAFAAIKALVIGRTLHHYYADKDALLRDRVRRRMAASGTDPFGYLALLRAVPDPAAEAEWTALEAEITVGETFFFRYAEQFAALSDQILPMLLRARADTRRMRIWSAGCATGAEPYSVAILLHRLLGERIADWSISILGTDLNAAALEAARRAEFGLWALRSLSEAERHRDFVPVEDGNGRRWRLRPQFHGMVRFERQNLLALVEPGAPPAEPVFDLVLCRNVLIYFHPDRVQALIGRFRDSLGADGWLLLGHAEAGSFTPDGLHAIAFDRTVAWVRAAHPAAVPGPPAPAVIPPPPLAARVRPAVPVPPASPAAAVEAGPSEDERAAVEQVPAAGRCRRRRGGARTLRADAAAPPAVGAIVLLRRPAGPDAGPRRCGRGRFPARDLALPALRHGALPSRPAAGRYRPGPGRPPLDRRGRAGGRRAAGGRGAGLRRRHHRGAAAGADPSRLAR